MWHDVTYLSSLTPFSPKILSSHILENPELWNKLQNQSMLGFKDFPNNHLIDLTKFKIVDFMAENEEKLKIDLTAS